MAVNALEYGTFLHRMIEEDLMLFGESYFKVVYEAGSPRRKIVRVDPRKVYVRDRVQMEVDYAALEFRLLAQQLMNGSYCGPIDKIVFQGDLVDFTTTDKGDAMKTTVGALKKGDLFRHAKDSNEVWMVTYVSPTDGVPSAINLTDMLNEQKYTTTSLQDAKEVVFGLMCRPQFFDRKGVFTPPVVSLDEHPLPQQGIVMQKGEELRDNGDGSMHEIAEDTFVPTKATGGVVGSDLYDQIMRHSVLYSPSPSDNKVQNDVEIALARGKDCHRRIDSLTAENDKLWDRIQRLEERLSEVEAKPSELKSRVNGCESDIRGLTRRLNQTQKALGGSVWKDMQGNSRWIGLLSDSHLKNIVKFVETRAGGHRSYVHIEMQKVLANVDKEIARREKDAEFRQRENTKMFPANVALKLHEVRDQLTEAYGEAPRIAIIGSALCAKLRAAGVEPVQTAHPLIPGAVTGFWCTFEGMKVYGDE